MERAASITMVVSAAIREALPLRFLVFIGMLAGLALPVNAANKLTVAQVEQILAADCT